MAVATTKQNNASVKPKVTLQDFGLNEIYDMIQRRKTFIILSVVMMWVLGIVYCYYAQQTYESSAQVMVMRKDTSLATTGAPSKASSDTEIKDDLLASHMQYIASQVIIDDALRQTIKKSDLDKYKTDYRASEALISSNLRFVFARLMAKQPEATATPAVAPEGNAGSEPANPTTTAVSTPAATTPPAATSVVATTPATTDPNAAAVTPAVVDGIAPVTGEEALVPEADFATVSEFEEKRKLLSSDPKVLPAGPTADGDMVLTLADLPVLVSELNAGQLPQQYVTENLIISRGGSGQMKTSHALTVAVRHPDPVEARLILDAILQSYERYLDYKFRDISKEASQLIEEATNHCKKDLLTAQLAYQLFREQSPILGSRADSSAANNNIHLDRYNKTQEILTNIGVELVDARSRLREVELKLVEYSKPGTNPWRKLSVIDDKNMARIGVLVTASMQGNAVPDPLVALLVPNLAAQKTADNQFELGRLSELVARKNALLTLYGESHSEILKISAEIESVKKDIERRANATPIYKEEDIKRPETLDPERVIDWYVGMLRSDVRVLETREQELKEQSAIEEELTKSLLPYELEEQRLMQEVRNAQELFDKVIDRLREVNLAKDYSGFVNGVIKNPDFGMEVWPFPPIVMIVASMLGMLMGVGGAAFAEYRDRSFRDPEDIRRDLGMTILTHIPSLQGKGLDKRQLVEGSKMHATVFAYHRPKSREAEVFRGLRTSLFFSTQGQKAQVIGFTSPNQGDGKSTVTSNLAVSIAQTGRKVLLVDCDLRRPNVHKLLGISNDVGLSDVIGGEMEPWDAIQQTETTNLWSLPSGPLPANPAELLTSATFEEFIKIAREKYDYILLDCPPVLAVADPCIVAPRTDGMTLVLRVSKDSRPQAARAKEMLDRVHARMLGVVVNASQEAHKTGYGRYGESSYAYSYDYGHAGKGYSSYNKYYEEDSATTARSKQTGR